MPNECRVSLNLLETNDLDDASLANVKADSQCEDLVSEYGSTRRGSAPLENSGSSEDLQLDHGIELRWSDLSYHARSSSSLNPFGQGKSKALIRNLNGSIRNGQLTAIIGPSGAGKTTLIECLSGRRINGVRGDVTLVYKG